MLTTVYTPIPVCGEVAAGRPTTSEQLESTCIPVDLASVGISPSARTFALRVRGDSMSGAHILDGDTVVLELKEAYHGAIVAAFIDGENTLKRYVLRQGIPFLHAENPKYPDVRPVRELLIQGVVIAVFRKL